MRNTVPFSKKKTEGFVKELLAHFPALPRSVISERFVQGPLGVSATRSRVYPGESHRPTLSCLNADETRAALSWSGLAGVALSAAAGVVPFAHPRTWFPPAPQPV